MPRYKQQFKEQIANRLLATSNNEALETVSMETGVPVHTLEMWRAQAIATSAAARGWTPQLMLEAVSRTMQTRDVENRNEWLRSKNVSFLEFTLWSIAAQDGLRAFGRVKRGEANAARLRIKVLERDLRKKDKAMADAATLFLDGYGDTDSDTDSIMLPT
ncbi:hypothetical protein ACFQ3P_43225 [Paraburkholderia sabiae]|uniref:Transposase n=1 Tax=Paraburkholderia sabiae TaxID=273251 RepID=A0ABU9QSK4_9BURK|nr:hypothetical protein [Paraburkholderia sabiae]WJZ79879.1 hypothetical protein QEN71_44580 [Paraburkholderia sabiae]